MSTYDPGVFLLVADAERPLTSTLSRALGRYRATVAVSTLVAFRDLLHRSTRCTGLVLGPSLDRHLPREALAALDASRENVPVALITDETVTAHDFGAVDLIAGASAVKGLQQFIRNALITEVCRNVRLTEFVVAHAERYLLTPREAEILAAIIAGIDRTDFVAELGISPNTQKRHVGSLLEKTGASNTDQLAIRVLRELASSLLPSGEETGHDRGPCSPAHGLTPTNFAVARRHL